MLQAYIDGSGNGAPDRLVLAGYIASAEEWARFSDEWQSRLDMHPRMGVFKMSEMVRSPVSLERAGWFYRVIEDHVQSCISVIIDVAGMNRAIDKFDWAAHGITELKELRNPYYFAFKAILHVIAQHRSKLGITEPVDFIFDEQTEKRKALSGWNRLKFSANPEDRAFLGSTPIYRPDDKVLPLQAADLIAYWIRDWHSRAEMPEAGERFPWRTSREMLLFTWEFGEADFLKEFERVRDPAVRARMLMSDEEIDVALSLSEGSWTRLWQFSKKLP